MPSGPVAFLALIFWGWFLTWVVVKDRLEQGVCVLEGVGEGVVLMSKAVRGGCEPSVVEWKEEVREEQGP